MQLIAYLTMLHICQLRCDFIKQTVAAFIVIDNKSSVSCVLNEYLKLLTVFCLEINWISLNHKLNELSVSLTF